MYPTHKAYLANLSRYDYFSSHKKNMAVHSCRAGPLPWAPSCCTKLRPPVRFCVHTFITLQHASSLTKLGVMLPMPIQV